MDETLFDEQTTEAETVEAPVETLPAQPAIDYNKQIDELRQAVAAVNQNVSQMAQIFQNAATSTATAPDPAPAGDLLNDLAARGDSGFNERVDRRVTELSNAQLAPHLQRLTETQHEGIMAEEEARIGKDFTQEGWDKIIKPGLEQDLLNLRNVNYQAIADRRSIKALVDRHVGMNYRALKALETAAEKKTQETQVANDISRTLPGSRGPRISLRNDEPDEDTKLFLAEIEAATGEKTDPKEFMAMHRAGNTLEDFLKVTAKPVKQTQARAN